MKDYHEKQVSKKKAQLESLQKIVENDRKKIIPPNHKSEDESHH